MSLTRAAVDNDRVTFVLVAVLILAGIQTYLGLPQAEDPGFTIRTALVHTVFPGASPERVEQLVTDKLEKAIQEIPELDSVTSQSKSGVSLIMVNIKERYTDMRPIWDDLRRRVDRASRDLPEEVVGPTVNDEFGDVFGTVLTLTGEGFSYRELKDVADEVRDELLLIPDSGKVDIFGAQEERIYVSYSNSRLADLGLSPAQLRSALSGRNIINPGGDFRTEYEEIVVEPTGNYESVEDVRSTLVTLPGTGEVVLLGDIARVRREYEDPPSQKARGTGRPALVLAVSMREGGNLVALGSAVRETVDRLAAGYPVGIEFDFVQFQAGAVEKKVDDFVTNLVQAVTIVMVVMLVSLGLRTGLVVASLIPSAIVVAFLFFPLLGVGIDQMSLAALIIALGLLVDNAIVMAESILVQMGEGKSPRDAALASADELRMPLLTSSLTTAAAFLPIFLAESAVGEYTGALFKVVTVTLLCSWGLSLTLVPLLSVIFLKVRPGSKSGAESFDSKVYVAYRRLLLASLRRPIVSLVAVALVFVGSLALFRFVPAIFFPPNDRPSLTAELFMPTGTPLAKTEEVALAVEDFMLRELMAGDDQDGIVNWVTFLGEGGPRFYLGYGPEQASPNYAILIVNTSTRAATDEVIRRLQAYCDRTFPGLKARVQPLQNGPSVSNPIEVRISGRETDKVFALVDRVKERLQSLEGPTQIADNWGARSKKIVVRVDPERAQRAGVTHQDVALSLQTLFSGFETTELREGEDLIPVVLRSAQARELDLEGLGSINVFSQSTGRSVPIAQVASAEMAWQPGNIRRRNRLQTVTVEADLKPGFTVKEVTSELLPWLEEESASWPIGYTWELGGEDEASAEANQSIAAQLPVAGMLIVLLLVAQFNSLRRPLIILATIPLGLIGVVVGLLVLRSYFGFMTLLGVVSLAGIVINNAIVLLDRIQIEIEDNGLSPAQAVVESGQRRLRPIVLTTFTTLGGMIPLYLGGGAMFEPMAAAIMFGLVFATALTLGFVPVLYSVLFRVDFGDYREPERS